MVMRIGRSWLYAVSLFLVGLSNSIYAVYEVNPLAYDPAAVKSPVIEERATGSNILLAPLKFYSRVLTKIDGPRCPSWPTCSLYSRQAIEKHGPIIGLWMTVDRLIRERTEIETGPRIIMDSGKVRIRDPLEDNDFWYDEKTDAH